MSTAMAFNPLIFNSKTKGQNLPLATFFLQGTVAKQDKQVKKAQAILDLRLFLIHPTKINRFYF